MTLAAWLAFAGAGALAITYILWVYRRRELSVRSRGVFAAIRATAVLLALLLLFDPTLPVGTSANAPSDRWVLVDRSLSMEAQAGTGDESHWDRARARAAELESEGWSVVGFGEEVGPVDSGSGAPTGRETVLGTALRRAVESGVSEVIVLSDRRILDPLAVGEAMERFSLDVEWEDLSDSPPNMGVESVVVPRRVQSDEPFTVTIRLRADGFAAGDSAEVDVWAGGAVVASTRVAIDDRTSTEVEIELPAPEQSGSLIYEVAAAIPTDGFVRDDRYPVSVPVDTQEEGLVFLSLSPDWEPRFLLPVLEQVTGLPARGYLIGSSEQVIPMGRDESTAPPDSVSSLRRAASDAELLVVHGSLDPAPDWIVEAVGRASRVILLPGGPARSTDLPTLPSLASVPGEWYATSEVPPSPLSGELAGVRFDGLPPVTALFETTLPDGATVPLQVGLSSGGRIEPAIYLTDVDGSRHAVVLTRGLWRWAFRPGEARDAYVRLWSGLSGWLLAGGRPAATSRVRPVDPVIPDGAPLQFRSVGPATETRLTISNGDGTVVDTVAVSDDAAIVSLPPLDPGVYRYSGSVEDGDRSEGELIVSTYTDDALVPRMEPAAVANAEPGSPELLGDAGRPLRTHPLPYLLILILLSLEWIGRRRRGLR